MPSTAKSIRATRRVFGKVFLSMGAGIAAFTVGTAAYSSSNR